MSFRTNDFARLYGLVNERLSQLTADPYWHRTSENEWLAYLVFAFQQLFEDWEHDQKLAPYLKGLETSPGQGGREVHRAFRLAGHVYLHVTYDLVRAVAVTLDAAVQVTPNELDVDSTRPNTLANPVPVTVRDRPHARLAFLGAAPAFSQALDSPEGIDLLGDISGWARFLRFLTRSRRQQALQVIAQWVLALRSAAFITAETIADVQPIDRPAIVKKLLAGIMVAQGDAQRSKAINVHPWGFPMLSVSTLPLLSDQPWTAAMVALLALILSWIWALFRTRRRQRALLNAIDSLGQGFLNAVVAVRSDAKPKRPDENRRDRA